MTTTHTSHDIASDVSSRTGKRLFGQRYSNSQSVRAEMELDGRTHYYDAGTRRYFGCRVLDCVPLCDGLILGTVESVAPPGSCRLYRCVFFDLLGNDLYRTEHETDGFAGWKTAASARKDFEQFSSTLTTETVAEQVIESARKAAERELAQLSSK